MQAEGSLLLRHTVGSRVSFVDFVWTVRRIYIMTDCDKIVDMNRFQQLYLWACARLYDELAWSYDLVSWLVSWGAWGQWRATALDHICGNRVLEIGFGTGTLLTTLAAHRYTVTGLEISTAMHRQAAHKLDHRGLAIPRVQAPAQAMPFANGAFDTILSTFPSSYITDLATLSECARLLRQPVAPTENGGPAHRQANQPCGRLVVVMGASAPQSPLSLIARLIYRQRHSHVGQHDDLLDRFVAAGFTANYVTVMQQRTAIYLIVADI